MTVNSELLDQVVTDALESAAGNVRWRNAIKRGAELIKNNRCVPQGDDVLLILSTSGHDYLTTPDECRQIMPDKDEGDLCKAFELKRPCKHRAAFQLLVRYHERMRQTETVEEA